MPVPADLERNIHGVPLNTVLSQAQRLTQPLPPFWREHDEFRNFVYCSSV